MDLVFFRRVPIDFNGEKKFSALFLMLLLVEGEEKECLLKFGVLIFILAHEIKQFYSLSWKHCMCLQAHAASFSKSIKSSAKTWEANAPILAKVYPATEIGVLVHILSKSPSLGI